MDILIWFGVGWLGQQCRQLNSCDRQRFISVIIVRSRFSMVPVTLNCQFAQRNQLLGEAVSTPSRVRLTLRRGLVVGLMGLTLLPTAVMAQTPTPSAPANRELGQALMKELFQCIQAQRATKGASSTPASGTSPMGSPSAVPADIQALAIDCTFKTIMLGPDGKVRPDAALRLSTLVKASGIKLPKPTGQGQTSVPLQPLKGSQVFTVPVTLGGQSLPFLVDTGASTSVVNEQTAQQLKLKGNPVPNSLLSYMMVGQDCSKVSASLYPLPEFAIAQASVKGVMGLGLSKAGIPSHVGGVMGMDVLSNFDLVLDPKTQKLDLLPPSQPATTATPIPLVGKMGVMTTQVKVNGQGPFTFLVDTGADTTVVSPKLAQQLGLKGTKPIDVTGFCGLEKGTQTQLSQLSLQQVQSDRVDAVILNSPVLQVVGVDGIIGQNVLNRYRQHWRFGTHSDLGFPENGTLELSPPTKP